MYSRDTGRGNSGEGGEGCACLPEACDLSRAPRPALSAPRPALSAKRAAGAEWAAEARVRASEQQHVSKRASDHHGEQKENKNTEREKASGSTGGSGGGASPRGLRVGREAAPRGQA